MEKSAQVLPDDPDPAAVAKVKADDIARDLARRVETAKQYVAQPPSFERDMRGVNSGFVRWYDGQPQAVKDDLCAYWTNEAIQQPDISHQHERGNYARMMMVLSYAIEKHGYDASLERRGI